MGFPARIFGREPYLAGRVRLIYSDTPATASINLIIAAVLAFVMRGELSTAILAGWFIFIAVVMIARFVLYARYKQTAHVSEHEARVWLLRLAIFTTLTAVGWGVGCLVVISAAPPLHKVFTAFVLGGMAAGGLPSLARIFRVYLLFVVPVLGPAIGYFARLGGEIGWAMAIMGVVMLAFLLMTGRRHERVVLEAMRLAGQNRELIERLTEENTRALDEKAKADRLNEELLRQVSGRQRIEQRLGDREKVLAAAQQIAQLGSWEWDIVNDEMTSSDENDRLFGRAGNAVAHDYASFLRMVHMEDRERVDGIIKAAIAECEPYSCDYRIILPDGGERVVFEQADISCDGAGRAVRVTGVDLDITERYQGRAATPRRQASGGRGKPGEIAVSRQYEPRTQDPAQRHHRL